MTSYPSWLIEWRVEQIGSAASDISRSFLLEHYCLRIHLLPADPRECVGGPATLLIAKDDRRIWHLAGQELDDVLSAICTCVKHLNRQRQIGGSTQGEDEIGGSLKVSEEKGGGSLARIHQFRRCICIREWRAEAVIVIARVYRRRGRWIDGSKGLRKWHKNG